jgi:hypothetical protein
VSQVLKLFPDHAKALYRRGCARHALGQTESALEDLTKAMEQCVCAVIDATLCDGVGGQVLSSGLITGVMHTPCHVGFRHHFKLHLMGGDTHGAVALQAVQYL